MKQLNALQPAPHGGAWRRTGRWAVGCALLSSLCAHAGFVNGDFEAKDFTGWTQGIWTNDGTTATATTNPQKLADLQRQPATASMDPLNQVVPDAPEATVHDLLWQSTPPGMPELMLPIRAMNSARINLTDSKIPRSVNPPVGFSKQIQSVSSIQQEVTLTADDVDKDGKIHIRFIAAPVLHDSNHAPNERPYFAISLVKTYDVQSNTTLGTPKELFFKYHYGGQAGVAWKTFTDKGGETLMFTEPQAYDVAPGNEVLRIGDKVRLEAIAAGCSPGGHSGHLYVDNFTTALPKGLWITASGPVSAPRNDATEITYTYTYTNSSDADVSNVVVTPSMPQDSAGNSTTFVSLQDTKGYCVGPVSGPTAPASCSVPLLKKGETLSFTMTVKVPAGTPTDQINNGNYVIGGDGVATLLGAMVQTNLLDATASSDMTTDPSGLPPKGTVGVPYPPTASFSCTNQGAVTANNAICSVTGLPPGVAVGQCKVNGVDWTQGDAVAAGQTVICPVSGTPTAPGTSNVQVTTGADNDVTPANNQAAASPVVIASPAGPASIPTLSEWGLILMSGLMGIMGWGMARRRRANPL
ncbi:MAG: IPTL-CTERM sorting domain-containing protein [Delftia acidovorans]|uniref:IPTL-CTERM sorting domain-containing protein n=1 Tax=Delftia sp. UME58 TaxID=1862322 RepID=UPI00160310F1|nr:MULTISPECIES: IPTL-CTERM sorting domain-containing protein [Delftia]MBB1651040.1 IPTL-CTERM sorting domain-containing protein [Delftia sp. UME58]MBL8356888.1 IPTL-CTERM sorting domain-containing protein [Delftia acidovorans]